MDLAPALVLDSSSELEPESVFCWPQPANKLSRAIDKIADLTIKYEAVCFVFLRVGFIISLLDLLIEKLFLSALEIEIKNCYSSELGTRHFRLLDIF